MELTAREAVLTTPRVALANDNTRLACMSPSNRLVRKRCTSVKQRVWLGCIAWLRESYCVPRNSPIVGARQPRHGVRHNAKSDRPVLILFRTSRDPAGFFYRRAGSARK